MLDKPIESLKGVGEAVAKKLGILGVQTIDDLIQYFPRRYDDYSQLITIIKLQPGPVSIKAVIKQAKGRYVRRGMHITEAVASDDTSSVRLVWFNQPYREGAIKKNQEYFISGVFELSSGRLAIMNPAMELASDFPVNTARIVPIYRETKGLKSGVIRKLVAGLQTEIENLPETLPAEVVNSNQLIDRAGAIANMHFPVSGTKLAEAKRRLGFEEVFALTVASLLNKQANQKQSALAIPFDEKLARQFVASLPFDLTNSQRRVVWQIYQDMRKPVPMNRLVEGDVGSGKTVVAAMAALMAMAKGYQVALMAPTELLARQHGESLFAMLTSVGKQNGISLLLGSMKPAEKKRAHIAITSGDAKFIIGTHALISEKVDMHKLGLIIVDEQHRFGVAQRATLQKKAGHMPHVLSMTATPIPRTLALTLYGELDISLLEDMPAGRLPIITKVVSPNSRLQMYRAIDKELEHGRQMFVVCPIIAESDVLNVLSAERVYEGLARKVFKHRRVGLLHGKMKPVEKEATMAQLFNSELDILVSTTVIEVGVHVPNATIMLIEGAERFGLAQLHQLRGRVGRSTDQGYCYLVMSDSKAPTKRLRAIEQSNDGFRLAEFDLEIRGPGAIYGSAQSGQLDLRIANLSDVRLIATARSSAQTFLDSGEKLSKYPALAAQVQSHRAVTNLS